MGRIRTSRWLGRLGAGALLALFAAQALAQAWPARPIRLVVPYPAGGGTDFFARLFAGKMSESLGQQILVENRPGASSSIGAEIVAKSAPDGYTLLVGDTATFAVNPFLYSKLPYDPLRDFTPVTRTIVAALLLAVPGDSKIQSVADFVAALKANPGKVNYGSPGPGAPHHLAMELFLQGYNLKATHVPYKGGAPALQDLLGGRLETMFLDLGTAGPHVKSGKVRALAVGNAARISALPNVPTVAETGLPGYDAFAWQGFAFPAGTPREIVTRVAAEYAKVAQDPQVRQKMEEVGFEATPSTPEQFVALIRSEQAKWSKVVREGKISLD
jgi:tripartite-type tricarboxylate transporter receptor subunit TctC